MSLRSTANVLINNAGITGSGQVSPEDAYDQVPSTVDLDMVRAVFETMRKDGILVNAVAPGYVDTDINNHTGFLTVAQGAVVLVRLATLGADGSTAGFFGEDGPIPR
jgi:hypothetical protein